MAKIVEEVIVIKLSRIAKDDATTSSVVSTELLATLETVAAELAGEGVVVEAAAA